MESTILCMRRVKPKNKFDPFKFDVKNYRPYIFDLTLPCIYIVNFFDPIKKVDPLKIDFRYWSHESRPHKNLITSKIISKKNLELTHKLRNNEPRSRSVPSGIGAKITKEIVLERYFA